MERIQGVLVLAIAELVARKMISYYERHKSKHPKWGTDRRDLSYLLLQYPALKSEHGTVETHLRALGAGPEIMKEWRAIANEEINPIGEEDF